jgi:hypothetical protein
MTSINAALGAVSLGIPLGFANLEMTPLLAPSARAADYLVLSEAHALGLVEVTEVSDAGRVATLLLSNGADKAVFLLDGEELVGAKQNRILNLSLLVPANTTLEIPVSCVEQGRWRHRSREFASSERTFFSKGRARKAARVSENLREAGVACSDQGEVWLDIDDIMLKLDVASSTYAIADAYEHFAEPVEAFVAALEVSAGQVGACFAINGSVRGIELFDSSDTCARLLPKLIRGYALDAINERQAPTAGDPVQVHDFLQAVALAPVDQFAALGEGDDIRMRSADIAGGALAARGRIVHLCAFRQQA